MADEDPIDHGVSVEDVFPSNAIFLMGARIKELLKNVTVQYVPVHSMNAGATVAILPIGWDNASTEEMGTFPREPAPIQSYTLSIQLLITGFGQERAISYLSLLSRRVRHTLMRDRVLREALQTLRCTEGDVDERFIDVKVRNQRYLGNVTNQGGIAFMASTDVIVRTEVIAS